MKTMPTTPNTTNASAATTAQNPIAILIRIRGIAKSYGAEFTFNSTGAAVFLPEKSAPFIMDHICDEYFQAGFVLKSPDAEGLGIVLMEKFDFKTLGFSWGKTDHEIKHGFTAEKCGCKGQY